jgi:predicted RNA binding protein YcfA (HicA-like mRNA interferase family)
MMASKEVAKIIRELERQGFTVKRSGGGHWLIYTADERWAATMSATPSDRRGLLNAIAMLRRAGFVWPPKG